MAGVSSGAPDLVQLDRDHPGFRDPVYRRRRNEIAQLALAHELGQPVPTIAYSDEEHGVWRVALQNLLPLHARHACREHLAQWPVIGFPHGRIPQLEEINRVLAKATGFSFQPVAGLVSPRTFMIHLADGVFLATQYMRHASTPLYTPEPDVIHELVGHAPLLSHPEVARLNRRFGEATRVADAATVERLIRVYWYALEFGLVREEDGLRAVGAGLLSSFGELQRFERAELRPFSVAQVARTTFDPTDYQSVLFVGESTRAMLGEVDGWLEQIISGR
jgi:phenylalanine-4-hydroxylase